MDLVWLSLMKSIKFDKRCMLVATLGSILDSQLSRESGKFQLTRWSHEVAILCRWHHPPTQPPHQLEIRSLNFFFQCCAVSSPQLFHPLIKYVGCSPTPIICFCVQCSPLPKLYLPLVELSIKLNLYLRVWHF